MNDWGFDEIVEPIARKFEDDWRGGMNPQIEEYLPVNPDHAQAVYWELVVVELELRLKAGENARVEDYIERFPLREHAQEFAALIGTEYRLRARQTPGLLFGEYIHRFPDEAPQLVERGVVRVLPPSGEGDSGVAPDEPAGEGSLPRFDSVTRFRLIEPHREGGLGKVWLAHDRELDRPVVIKEIKEALADHPHSRERFIREATVTARLQHPGIVPVYGLGAHFDGRPFYAMKFIEGKTLNEVLEPLQSQPKMHTDASLRPLLARLISVCQTIEYAHSKGVLHRDIKPSNIMLAELGETLVVDWGMLKLAGERDPELDPKADNAGAASSASTTVGRALGSPAYMSPEQARGDQNIGPATDIYSLGGTLLTVLTGHAPVTGETSDEVLHKVREGQVRWPDATVPAPLRSICRRAMQFAPSDRYASAAELARDLERYLDGRPVTAHQESLGERWTRFERNNRNLLRLVGLCLLAMTVLSASAAAWSIRERRIAKRATASAVAAREAAEQAEQDELAARLKAESAAAKKTRLMDSFAMMFAKVDPLEAGRAPTVAEYLDHIVDGFDEVLEQDPIEYALLLHYLGNAYRGVGRYEEAIRSAERSVKLLETHAGQLDEQTLEAKQALAVYLGYGGDERSVQLLREILDARKQTLGITNQRTAIVAGNLASAYTIQGRMHDAIKLMEVEMADWFASPESDQTTAEEMRLTLASAYERVDPAKAIEILEQIVEGHRGQDLPAERVLPPRKNLMSAYAAARRYEDAVALGDDTLDAVEGQLPDHHVLAVVIHSTYARALSELGRVDEAIRYAKRMIAPVRQHYSHQPLMVAQFSNTAGTVYSAAGKFEEAVQAYTEALAAADKAFSPQHPLRLIILRSLGWAYLGAGDADRAIESMTEYANLRADDPSVPVTLQLSAQQNLFHAYVVTGRSAAARELLTKLKPQVDALDDADSVALAVQVTMAMSCMADGEVQEAARIAEDALALIGEGELASANAQNASLILSQALLRQGAFDEAERVARQQLDRETPSALARARFETIVGETLLDRDTSAAKEWLHAALEHFGDLTQEAAYAKTLLGVVYSREGKLDQASELLSNGHEAVAKHVANRAAHEHYRLRKTAERLMKHYTRAGLEEQAREWQAKLAEFEGT